MSNEEFLNSIDKKLGEILKWLKFASLNQLRTILSQTLENDVAASVYELSNGKRGTREIAKLVGVKSNATIAAYWKRWAKLGIVEESSQYQGRYVRICSLEEVGLTVPPLPELASVEQKEDVTADE
ncbi:MAG: hypothetical protein ACFCUE_10975 [Candidatus Bathyarchaeia archaeon]